MVPLWLPLQSNSNLPCAPCSAAYGTGEAPTMETDVPVPACLHACQASLWPEIKGQTLIIAFIPNTTLKGDWP